MAKSKIIDIKKRRELEAVRRMTPTERFMEAIELSHLCDKLKKAARDGSSKRG